MLISISDKIGIFPQCINLIFISGVASDIIARKKKGKNETNKLKNDLYRRKQTVCVQM